MRCHIHFCCSNQRRALIIHKRRFHGVFGFSHVGTATKSVRQYRLQMARFGRASATELHRTFQDRAYYTHAQFIDEMRKVLHFRNQWAQLAGLPVSEQIDLEQNSKQSDRDKRDTGAREVKPLSRGASGQRRLPASTILAAVAGRL
jgi:hypothetical protein